MIRLCDRGAESQKKRVPERKVLSPNSKSLSCHQKLQEKRDGETTGSNLKILGRTSTSFYEKRTNSINNSYSGVKRHFSVFNKIGIDQPTEIPRRQVSGNSFFRQESNYVSNMKTTTKYVGLKIKASKAVRNKMIFTINVNNGDIVRKCLTDRGWVEKLSPNVSEARKKCSKTKYDDKFERLLLSNLVIGHPANFIWDGKENSYCDELDNQSAIMNHESFNLADPSKAKNEVIKNHFENEVLWTTKEGLYNCYKNENQLDIPRIYMNPAGRDMKDFLLDYKLTACTSLLKWVLTKVAKKEQIFTEKGTISTNVIIFAINRCKEYLFSKENKNFDLTLNNKTTSGQWNSFLRKYFQLIEGEDQFHSEKNQKLPLFIGYAKLLLKRIYKYRPLVSCEGYNNIWIMKPTDAGRGKEIRMASSFGAIADWVSNKPSSYIVQKYIEDPLLIHDTKFVIRQYYLVTSLNPLIIWMYKDCYLKFSSQKYSLSVFHESIHFTNYTIQKKYEKCPNRHSEVPKQNMWDLETFKRHLEKNGQDSVWDTLVYPSMKETIMGTMLNSDGLTSDGSKRCFGLYGCDFILDKDYRPWLIQINSCSDPKFSTDVAAVFYTELITNVLKVVIDRSQSPEADTGKFEYVCPPVTTPQVPSSLVAPNLVAPNSEEEAEKCFEQFSKKHSKPRLELKKSKAWLKSKSTLESRSNIDSRSIHNSEFNAKPNYNNGSPLDQETYIKEEQSEESMETAFVKQVDDLCKTINSDNHSVNSVNSVATINPKVVMSSSTLVRKAKAVGTQFARLLLSYFLIHIHSLTGISTLPSIVLESKRLRDSLRLQMSSPSKFFSTLNSPDNSDGVGNDDWFLDFSSFFKSKHVKV